MVSCAVAAILGIVAVVTDNETLGYIAVGDRARWGSSRGRWSPGLLVRPGEAGAESLALPSPG